MIRIILTIACVFFAIPAWADTMTLAKHYKASGKNPDGSSYSGTVDVDVISDTTFTIVWHISGSTYKGFGMRNDNSLAGTYTIDGEPGLVIYKALDGGVLAGLWAVRGENGSGSEVLTPTK